MQACEMPSRARAQRRGRDWLSKARSRALLRGPRKYLLRAVERALPNAGADASAVEIVEADVDPAPNARLACLICGVVVGRPLEADFGGRSEFEEQVTRVTRVAAESAGEELRTGQAREHGCRRTTERAVSRHVAGKGRCDEGAALIRNPIDSANPTDARDVGDVVARFAAPRANGDLTQVARSV